MFCFLFYSHYVYIHKLFQMSLNVCGEICKQQRDQDRNRSKKDEDYNGSDDDDDDNKQTHHQQTEASCLPAICLYRSWFLRDCWQHIASSSAGIAAAKLKAFRLTEKMANTLRCFGWVAELNDTVVSWPGGKWGCNNINTTLSRQETTTTLYEKSLTLHWQNQKRKTMATIPTPRTTRRAFYKNQNFLLQDNQQRHHMNTQQFPHNSTENSKERTIERGLTSVYRLNKKRQANNFCADDELCLHNESQFVPKLRRKYLGQTKKYF